MCIPHGAIGKKDSGYVDVKPKRSVTRVSQDIFEKGDPDFVDERVIEYEKPKTNKSFLTKFFND